MARNKYPEITINRILDAAQKLFTEKGYEHTTMQDIVDELGDLSKGAIYHHFKSKELIIDAVINRMYKDSNPLDRVANIEGLNGLEKLRAMLIFSLTDNRQIDMVRASSSIFKNPKFLSVQINDSLTELAPYVRALIEEGNADGSVSVKYPHQVSECAAVLLNTWLSASLFSSERSMCIDNIKSLKLMFDGIGLPIINDDIIIKLGQMYDKVHA